MNEKQDGVDSETASDEKPQEVMRKMSAQDVIDAYYTRRYNMYKEKYENGNTSR